MKQLLITTLLVLGGLSASAQPKASFSDGVLTVNGVRYEFVRVEAGTFTMGATTEMKADASTPQWEASAMWGLIEDESPAHQVTLTKDFCIGKTEVTQALWTAVMGDNPSDFKGGNKPVETVTWAECQEFIKKLNSLTGKNFRLPTEAEWEYAARGGKKTQHYKYSGSNNLNDVAWYEDNSGKTTHDVATKQANELGIYDMSGNVSEWCQDWHAKYKDNAQTNPTGPSAPPEWAERVLRGGAWTDYARSCRSSARSNLDPDNGLYNTGLRLVLSESVGGLSASAQPKASFSDGTLIVNGAHYDFALVEGGSFTMGATPETDNPNDDEFPTRKVTLTHNYYMCKTEVSQALWKAVMGNNPSHFKDDRKPVEQVSWNDCQTFIKKLNAATGKNFRLPTEAEWEFAARGGIKTRQYQYSGSDSWNAVVWCIPNSDKETHDVVSKQPNELGLYNMSGNVSEWCQDWYGEYGSVPQTDPSGALSGTARVYRGGSWETFDAAGRSSWRQSQNPEWGFWSLGFRLAITDDSESATKRTPSIANGDNDVTYSNGVLSVNGVRYEMLEVKAGSFTMGATSEMQSPETCEKPAHRVTLTKDYLMGKTEVTQALWKAVTGKNPSWWDGDNRPVEGVSWGDCQNFISMLNAATGKSFRLPTEAEWEYAARGGKKSKHYIYSGSNNADEVAWCEDNSMGKTHDVATKQPNELGLYDMSGNVSEWCQDWFGNYSNSPQTNPTGATAGTNRVSRGSNFRHEEGECRTSCRGDYKDGRYAIIGLRLVLTK
jgi:formylglycine-generating enzyme required for sulfatase activity